jgi:hypothetical protein
MILKKVSDLAFFYLLSSRGRLQIAYRNPRRPGYEKPVTLTSKDRKLGARKLRNEAGWAYLDGRNARAKELNRKADLLERELKKTA